MNQKIKLLPSCMIITSGMIAQTNTKIIAHRGAWKEFNNPENSIASLQKAIELKCYGSEFDVRRTSDGILVVNHDPTFYGDTIQTHTYAQLNEKKLSNGEDLPTLEKYFKTGTQGNHKTLLICEIKEAVKDEQATQLATLETLALADQLGIQNRIVYISFSFEVLKTIKSKHPEAIVLYLENNKSIDEIIAQHFDGINYHFDQYKNNPHLTQQASKNNLKIGSWTVNKIEDLEILIQQGVEFITTNAPQQFLEKVSK